MAKFRQGNLILNATEKIIQGGETVVDDSGVAQFDTYDTKNLDVDSVSITKFSNDSNLGSSDLAVPTQNAVKVYVDSKISGSIAASTDNALARYDGTDGIQGSGITVGDGDGLSGISTISASGNITSGSGDDFTRIEATGAVEICDSGAEAFIDFKSAAAEDFDCRIIQNTNGLRFYTGGNGSTANALTINSAQNIIVTNNLTIQGTNKSAGYLYAGTTDPTNTTRLNYDGHFYATKTFNNVWNDYADYQKVIGKAIPGKCYADTLKGAVLCTEYNQKSVIGIISDTYGHAVGIGEVGYAPFGISGWVLAYIEPDALKKIEPGDALTSSPNGNLTIMLRKDVKAYPDRVVAIYKKPEPAKFWGPADHSKIEVKGRHWVKIK